MRNFTEADKDRFCKYLRRDEETGCLLWTGAIDKYGYGVINVGGREGGVERAYRVAWVLAGNEITEERPHVLHDCPNGDNNLCCEPTHLWAGTHQDNMRDRAAKKQSTEGRGYLPYGVSQQQSGRYQAVIKVDGKLACLGTYDTAEEASAVSRTARDKTLEHLPALRDKYRGSGSPFRATWRQVDAVPAPMEV